MATQQEAFNTVATHFLSNWASRTTVFVDNSTETNRAGEPTEPMDGDWTTLEMTEVTTRQNTLGPIGRRDYRRDCICNVVIRVPKKTGTRGANEHAQRARDILEGVRLANSVIINDVEIIRVGVQNKWYAISVMAEFFYIETK